MINQNQNIICDKIKSGVVVPVSKDKFNISSLNAGCQSLTSIAPVMLN